MSTNNRTLRKMDKENGNASSGGEVKASKDLLKQIMDKENENASSGGEMETSQDLLKQIAEAAYYRAEKRGFEPGQEMDDWFVAEQEIYSSLLGC